MNDILHDISVLEDAIINVTEGASDEKRMAIWSLQKLIEDKQKVVDDFESEYEPK